MTVESYANDWNLNDGRNLCYGMTSGLVNIHYQFKYRFLSEDEIPINIISWSH